MTVDPRYFDRLYARSADPYGFATRWYERRKYAISLAMLPRERYSDAFEPGCSIGVLTQLLARRCDRLLACDAAEAAARSAASRLGALPNVRVQCRLIPRDWPTGDFDLIILSELLYYFSDEDLDRVIALAVAALRPGGTLLAVHWRREAAQHPQTGDDVHAILGARAGLTRLARYFDADFAAETYTPTDGDVRSVAEIGGVA